MLANQGTSSPAETEAVSACGGRDESKGRESKAATKAKRPEQNKYAR